MKPMLWACTAALLLLLRCPAAAAERPPTTAMIGLCVYQDWVLPGVPQVQIQLIGGILAGTGWVSELMFWNDSRTGPWKVSGYVTGRGPVDNVVDSQHFMREGERVSVYYLESGVLGEARLLGGASDAPVGLLLDAEPVLSQGKENPFRTQPRIPRDDWTPDMLAVWAPGRGRPRWVTGKLLARTGAVYRAIVARWLARKGVSREAAGKVVLEQIVRADINGDGRDETFLSFHTPGAPVPGAKPSSRGEFSYLLMRYLPKHSRRVQTAVLDDSPARVYRLHGFCDLDEDGAAEVATTYSSEESEGTALFRWDGHAFKKVAGQEGSLGD